MKISLNIKTFIWFNFHMIEPYHFWDYSQKNQSQLTTEKPVAIFIVALFIQASYGISLGAHQQMDG
jgi:hypothetical protein